MPDAPLPVRPIALDDERQLRDSLFYPYDCMASVRAHDAVRARKREIIASLLRTLSSIAPTMHTTPAR